MPCLSCQSSTAALAIIASREKGPTSDELVFIFGLSGRVTQKFLSPRLCMVCGVVFCPVAVEVPRDLGDLEAKAVAAGKEIALGLPRNVDESGLPTAAMAGATYYGDGARFTATHSGGIGGVGGGSRPKRPPPERETRQCPDWKGPAMGRKPEPVVIQLNPNTAKRVRDLLDERCQSTRGAMDDSAMAEAFLVVATAYRLWSERHGEEP